jgi:hypothetical protein
LKANGIPKLMREKVMKALHQTCDGFSAKRMNLIINNTGSFYILNAIIILMGWGWILVYYFSKMMKR